MKDLHGTPEGAPLRRRIKSDFFRSLFNRAVSSVKPLRLQLLRKDRQLNQRFLETSSIFFGTTGRMIAKKV
jgi:hypothetical protein